MSTEVKDMSIKELHTAMEGAVGKLGEGVKAAQDAATKALEEVRTEGTLHKATNEKLTKVSEENIALQAKAKEYHDRILALEQKSDRKFGLEGGGGDNRTAGEIFTQSEEFKEMVSRGDGKSRAVSIPRKSIVNATGQNQALVPSDRRPGIITPPQRRLTVRDLLPQIPTNSNLIEFVRENVFTNSAAPQGSNASPSADIEGQAKAESNITFTLATSAVITLAHWIAASRQVLSDAPQLTGYIDSRLSYGLKLEEEDELLNSSGASGELDGLVNQATDYNRGATNDTVLDTLLKAFLQVSLAEYEADAVVMHPTDWTNLMLLKDTTNRYLFSDPHSTEQPRVWGRVVVPTASKTVGTFLTGAFSLGAAIYDRENMTMRISENTNDDFIRNMVRILVEERIAFVMYRTTAFVTGNVSHAG